MVTTQELLKLAPLTALKKIIQDSLKLGFDVETLNISEHTALTGTATQVRISVNRALAPVDKWVFEGEVPFVFQRLNMEPHFANKGLSFIVDFPLTVTALMKKVEEKTGQKFVQDDYQTGTITEANAAGYRVLASPKSLRWIGSMPVALTLRIKPLSEVILATGLDQMAYPVEGQADSAAPLTRLLEAVNRLNALRLDRPIRINEVNFNGMDGTAGALDSPNTKIKMSISTSDRWKGEIWLDYHRRYLPKMQNYLPDRIISSSVTTTRELAILVAQKRGFYLDPNDVIVDPLPIPTGSNIETVTIFFKETSLMYTGELTVNYSRQ